MAANRIVVPGMVSSVAIQAAALEVSKLLDAKGEAFVDLVETGFAAAEENLLTPFRFYVFLEKAVGLDRMKNWPDRGTKQVITIRDENNHETHVAHNNPDKYEYYVPNGKGGQVRRTGSFFDDTFDDTAYGKAILEDLRLAAVHDKEPSRFSSMDNDGVRQTHVDQLKRKQRTGRRNIAIAATFAKKVEALKAMKYGNGQPCFLIGFAITKDPKTGEEMYDFNAQPCRIIDNSDPANGSLGRVKFCSVTWVNGIDIDELLGLEPTVNKWTHLMTPKKRQQEEGAAPEGTVPPIEGMAGFKDYLAEQVAFIGNPEDTGKDSFYARCISALDKNDSDDFAENLVTMYEALDGIVSKISDRVTRIKARRAAALADEKAAA